MTRRRRRLAAGAAIVAHTAVATAIGYTFHGLLLYVVAVPWIASGLAMGLALGTWIERGA